MDIIYHSAASVRFNDALQEAVITNVRSTREMCYLALKCQRLKAYIHISTTYCNVDIDHVEETIYDPPMQWQTIIRLAEENNASLQALTNKCMHPFPNSYTFTKRLAEIAANELLKDKVPLVIVRPSIGKFNLCLTVKNICHVNNSPYVYGIPLFFTAFRWKC